MTAEVARVLHGALIRDPNKRCPSMLAWLNALRKCQPMEQLVLTDHLHRLDEISRIPQLVATRPSHWLEVGDFDLSDTVGGDGRDPLLGTKLSDTYLIDKVLGQGGMGAVYHAIDNNGNERAVKVIKPELLAVAKK